MALRSLINKFLSSRKSEVSDLSWLQSKAVSGTPFQSAPTTFVALRRIGDFIPCRLAMDDSSAQPETSMRCQTCGHWTEEGCPGKGKYVSGINGQLSDVKPEHSPVLADLMNLRALAISDGLPREQIVELIDRLIALEGSPRPSSVSAAD